MDTLKNNQHQPIDGQVKRPITTVLFDLDGTLVNSIPDLAYATNAMLADLNRPAQTLAQVATYVGKGMERLIHRALAQDINASHTEAALFELALVSFRRHYHEINNRFSTLYPGVIEGLTLLQKQGFKLGLVTNKPVEFTLPLLEHRDIFQFFECVIGGDTCERKKPFPDPLFYACQKLGSTVTDTLFVGDSSNDSKAANVAGMACLIVPYGYNEGQDVRELQSNAIVNDIPAVAQWLEQYNNLHRC